MRLRIHLHLLHRDYYGIIIITTNNLCFLSSVWFCGSACFAFLQSGCGGAFTNCYHFHPDKFITFGSFNDLNRFYKYCWKCIESMKCPRISNFNCSYQFYYNFNRLAVSHYHHRIYKSTRVVLHAHYFLWPFKT